MATYFAHVAAITVRLPSNIAADVLIDALRQAGIPMDATGCIESGYLFQRDNQRKKRYTMFRWFAGDLQGQPARLAGQGGNPPSAA